jgi:ribosomal protein S18 acetylase RimI-like enzyme
MGAMIIRELEGGDVAALAALARKTYADAFGHSFSAADLTAYLQSNLSDAYFLFALDEDGFLGAEVGGRLIGFVQFGAVSIPVPAPSPEDRELRRLYVEASVQGQGIGTRLMEAALAHPRLEAAANIYLDVWEHNHRAQVFYRRYGFAVIGAHSLAVASGAAADQDLIMVRRSRSPLS